MIDALKNSVVIFAMIVVVWLLYQYVTKQQQLAYQAARRGGISWGNSDGSGFSVNF